ncbi:hypothetical protein F4809DRAFT_595464 [Biscogniauxia mediterranea]|nr:hypothetical protein F4809DRAFT_595464 [Biscogniauxia mediterranea]
MKIHITKTIAAHLVLGLLLGVHGADPPSITLAPETTAQTGDMTTKFQSISGITANTQTTTVVNGTTTVLPVWYCAPTETAEVCKNCPTTTKGSPAECTEDFNALVLLPALAVVGVWIPPPPGLPTLTIPTDGGSVSTLTPTRSTPTSTSTSTEDEDDDELPTLPVSCLLPTVKIAAQATDIPGTTYYAKPTGTIDQGPPVNTADNPLPVLPETGLATMDPTQTTKRAAQPYQTAALGCGADSDPYWFNNGFFQYGNSFSRVEALASIKQYCADMAKDNAVLGPKGHTYDFGGKTSSQEKITKLYKLDKGDSGQDRWLAIRGQFDVDSRMRRECIGDDKPIFPFKPDGQEIKCYQHLGQTIDYCQPGGNEDHSTDKNGKIGGTFWKDCVFWDVFLASTTNKDLYDGRYIGEDEFKRLHPDW